MTLHVTQSPAKTVVTVTGDWDMGTTDQLQDTLHGAVTPGGHLVVDLTSVRFMDSATLGVLVGTRKRVLAARGTLTLVCATQRTLRLFELTNLDSLFTIVPSLDQ